MVKLCVFVIQCLFFVGSLANWGNNGRWDMPNFDQDWNNQDFGNQDGNVQEFGNQNWNLDFGNQDWNTDFGNQDWNQDFGNQDWNWDFGNQDWNPDFGNQDWNPDFGNQDWDTGFDDWNSPGFDTGGNKKPPSSGIDDKYQPPEKVETTPHPQRPSTSLSCGSTPIEPVGDIAGIIGGTTAKPYSWPWQIFLKIDTGGGKYLSCGGSLISKDWVLTASHCLKTNPRASDVTVYAGLFKQQEWKSGQAQTLKVAKYYRNPKYKGGNSALEVDGEDVTLLKLKTPATFNDKVQKVCLPKEDSAMVEKGARMTVTGWLMTSISEHGGTSDPLKQLTVQNIGNARINGRNFNYCDTKDEICAPGRQSGGSFYSGDSGGPLVSKKGNRWFQYGVVSGWKNWVDNNKNIIQDITVYARVTIHCNWIRKVTGMEICQ